MKKTLVGGCVCGATRYTLTSAPRFVHCCHCRDCQKQAGAPFITNAMIEADRIAVTKGAPTPVAVPSSTKSAHHVFRCPECQSPLWSRYGVREPMRYVRVATLDASADIAPAAHIFTRSKPAWLVLDDGIPAYAAWYDRAKIWPAESLARLTGLAPARRSSRAAVKGLEAPIPGRKPWTVVAMTPALSARRAGL